MNINQYQQVKKVLGILIEGDFRMVKNTAVLTIHNASKLTSEQRKDVANWLAKQAKDLFQLGNQYGKKVICRFSFGAKSEESEKKK